MHGLTIEQLRGTAEMKLLLTLMQAVSEGREEEWVERTFAPLVQALRQPDVAGFIREMFTYLIKSGGQSNASTFDQVLSKVADDRVKSAVMTLAEQYMERGRQQARQEAATLAEQYMERGRQQAQQQARRDAAALAEQRVERARREALLRVLETRFGVLTSASRRRIDLLAGEEPLGRALELAAASVSLEAFLAALPSASSSS